MNKEQSNEEAKKLMALAGIKESDKKFLSNESFSEELKVSESANPDSDFQVIEFNQEEVEPGPDDEKLYKLK